MSLLPVLLRAIGRPSLSLITAGTVLSFIKRFCPFNAISCGISVDFVGLSHDQVELPLLPNKSGWFLICLIKISVPYGYRTAMGVERATWLLPPVVPFS